MGSLLSFRLAEQYTTAEYAAISGRPARPYQFPIMEAIDSQTTEQVTICAPNQTGKSFVPEMAIQAEIAKGGDGDLLAVFPGDELAVEMSDRLGQAIRASEDLLAHYRPELSKPRDGDFRFNSRRLSYQTAGTDIIALTYKKVWASEPDRWLSTDQEAAVDGDQRKKVAESSAMKGRDNIFEVKNRVRAWRGRGGLAIFDCTPSLAGGPIWREFLKGSQGFYHLRCLNCGCLSMRSCDLAENFQFARNIDGDYVDGSARLICTTCGNHHTESMAPDMVTHGAYVHEKPDRVTRSPSFQWGALAAPWTIRWHEIAEAVIRGGASGSFADQKHLDNGFRGLPLQSRPRPKTGGGMFAGLHLDWKPTPKTRCLLMSIDTQDDCFKWTIRAYDDYFNSDHVAAGISRNVDGIRQAFGSRYHGCACLCGIWDAGGHRGKEVMEAVAGIRGMYAYKGDTKALQFGMEPHFKISDNVAKLILANPYWYQSELLHRIRNQPKPETWAVDRRYAFSVMPPERLPDTYIAEIEVMAPGKGDNGNEYRNWRPRGEALHDFFDAEKMNLTLLDFALHHIDAMSGDRPIWIGGKKPLLWRADRRRNASK